MDVVEVERDVTIPIEQITLYGTLRLPRNPQGIIVFAHGSGSSRFSPRNVHVAREFAKAGFASLLFDLLTNAEERIDAITAHIRFNIPFLADRMVAATKWLYTQRDIRELPIGFFGASTGGGAAIEAAAKLERESDELGPRVRAVVSRGGRPDLASDLALRSITCPVLLIVGGEDRAVISMNRSVLEALGTKDKHLVIVPGATHLFEEPGKLDEVARHSIEWFTRFLRTPEKTEGSTAGARRK